MAIIPRPASARNIVATIISARTAQPQPRAIEGPPAGTTTALPAVQSRPLTPKDNALRYAMSVVGHGTLKTPVHTWERAWDWVKVSHMREGGTHRGPVSERHAAAYTKIQQERAARAGAVVKTMTKPWTTRARIGKNGFPVALGTWGLTAGEVAHAAFPAHPFLGTFIGGLNGLLAEAVAAVVSVASPVALPAAGIAGLAAIGGSIRREHERRGARQRIRDGVDSPEDGKLLPAVVMADCATPEDAMEAVRRALALERVNVRPLSATVTPWGWEVVVQLLKGQPSDIVQACADLETLLDVREGGVLPTPHRDRRARVTLRIIESDPWATMPDDPDYTGRSWSSRDAIWLGKRLDGAQMATSFLAKHGLILAASGGGKSIFVRRVVDGLGAAKDVHLWDLDPSGVGQAPQEAVMGRIALSPEDCEAALTDAVAIAVGRTRLLRKLGMGDSWQASAERPAIGVVVDEFPRLTQAGKAAAVTLLRIGRKAKVFLLFASQDAKKDVLGDSIAGQVAFKAGGPGLQPWQEDLLWGPGAAGRGWHPGRYQPATSEDNPQDAGVFYITGAGDDAALPMKVGFMSGRTAQARAEQYARLGYVPMIDAESLKAAGLDPYEVYTRTDEEEAEAAQAVVLEPAEAAPVPEEALAMLEAIADDIQAWPSEWVPASELAAVAAARMGWEPGKLTEMRVAELLNAAYIPVKRRNRGIVRPRAALLSAVGRDLLATA
ncbi:hypothetical protein [Nonomuraea sp. NPDC050786]|uniref:hypothetical protein n=1 Tax=Nonomuraea sp. NPDC050786 TaxID=3154840 RepID=UPI0033EF6F8D